MQYKDLEKLVKLIEASGFDEFEWQSKSEKVRFKRSPTVVASNNTAYGAPMFSASPMIAPQHTATESKAGGDSPAKQVAQSTASNVKQVMSPFVGTYYEAPAPDAPKYTEIGRSFKKGDVLCIVEAMKIMNEIEAEFSGKVSKVLVKNGQPVQYGQPLFEVEI